MLALNQTLALCTKKLRLRFREVNCLRTCRWWLVRWQLFSCPMPSFLGSWDLVTCSNTWTKEGRKLCSVAAPGNPQRCGPRQEGSPELPGEPWLTHKDVGAPPQTNWIRISSWEMPSVFWKPFLSASDGFLRLRPWCKSNNLPWTVPGGTVFLRQFVIHWWLIFSRRERDRETERVCSGAQLPPTSSTFFG